ncbi:hypothetical protein [Clostridium sp.]|uniref:hypothetical protein n=1 Tax=Clostridium sp. TaxID=1506 RepID=UPI00262B7628|nr:hypothetical protein [uncultured Clostridium sp.]
MLSINKLGSDKAYEFVFDAKYKIDTSTEYQKSYGGIGSKEEEEYKNHDFYKSIEEVNIGGISFLPSTTRLMEEFLDKPINESSYSTFYFIMRK